MYSTTPPTSPKPSAAAPQETPKYMSKSYQGYEVHIRMNLVRESILYDMGPSIPEVPFSYFISSCTPPVDEETVSNLKKGKSKSVAQSGVAQDTTQQQEATMVIGETELFRPLADCFNAVLEEVKTQKGSVSLFKFSSEANSKASSEGRHANYKTDVDGLLTKSRAVTKDAINDDYECDLVFIGEYKKYDNKEARDSNILKIVGNANHIMGSDPTRRFMFGMTVEHTNTRIWFFSRSHVFVTEKIDLQEDAKLLVHFIIALGCADLSELGFDLTVERVKVEDDRAKVKGERNIQYRFMIGGKKYETTDILNDHKAKFLLGCASRVYKVRLVDENGSASGVEYVMKDLWIPEGSLTEKETYDRIQANLNLENPVQDLSIDEFSERFVVIKECERVKVRSTCNPQSFVADSTSKFLRKPFPEGLPRYPLRHKDVNYAEVPSASVTTGSNAGTVGSPLSFVIEPAHGQFEVVARSHYENKVHSRILMEYAGESISKVTDLKTLMICLGQVVKALEYMYSAGYVHRDISIGNILYSEVNGRIVARLGDLEYAKQVSVPSESHRDLKTGTPHFIACEVERGNYLFRPNHTMPIAAQSLLHRILANQTKTQLAPTVPFRLNYLHDLESVWWIMVFFLFTRIPANAIISHEQLQVQRDTCKLIFPHPFTSQRRQEFFTNSTVERDSHMAILSSEFQGACMIVQAMADFLRMQYGAVEAMPDFPAGRCFSGIHESVRSGYLGQPLVDVVFNGPLENLPPASPDGKPPTTGAKRKMDETEGIVEGASTSKKGRQGRR
ncbi:hypothetical protein Moror_11083 [Moniliophthora roreri MCA 2997]|uniref:Protein kinase domain-containing protein n=1 Tax=Moniliophthora roreri (strain MCA 2997) TaxID=1381753 RepID=V2WUM2_MONRO|nr:hypothetical protein Moror_11083 [Moniliophthora roreri MCA 2997]